MWWIVGFLIFIVVYLFGYILFTRSNIKTANNAAIYWRKAFNESIDERDEALRALRYYDDGAAKRIADAWWERYRNKSRDRIMSEMLNEGEEV